MSVRGESPEEERRSSTRGRIFPLNSGRLTATIVTRIAKGLHLPQSASLEETRQMIEGELLSEREPRNVQVIIEEAAPGVTISLRDESGVFLEIAPDEPGDGGKSGEASEAEEGEGSVHGGAHEEDPRSREHLAERRLRNSVLEGQESDGESRALELEQEVAELVQEKNQLMGENTELAGKNVELSEQSAALTEEVIKLRGSLGEEKEKNRAEWRRNCQLLIEYDDLLTAKDQEIADLKSRLERLTAEHGEGKGKELETSGEEATPLAPITPSRLTAGGGSHVSSREPFRRRPREELGGACISDEHVRVDKGSICSNITAGGTKHPSRVRATTRTRRPPGIAKEDEGSPSIDVIARGTSDGWTTPPRRGKAPPVDPFSGEVPDSIFDDWLPALQRAAAWNGWSDEEKLLQLAGHLRGRALQEWNLLRDVERETFEGAVDSLRTRIDPGSRTLAAQDFRHTIQREQESVSEFIRRLEQTFRLAYGKERMSTETRDMLLHGQLQEGLRYDLMKAPAVSGSHDYKELSLASRNEEKRLAELAMRRQYLKQPQQLTTGKTDFVDQSLRSPTSQPKPQGQFSRRSEGDKNSRQRQCYNCNKPGHLAWECREERTESAGRGPNQRGRQVDTKQVCTSRRGAPGWVQQSSTTSDLLSNLLSSDSASDDAEEGVRQIRVHDQGSKQQFAEVQIEGVPAKGVIDSGAEITIIGGKLFARIAAVARLKKSQLKAPDRIPKTYDRRSFTLDGRMDLDVSFGGMSMQTPVYIKVDAPEQLLLAEGVCRQLNIITYHPSVTNKRSRTEGDNRPKSKKMKSNGGGSECSEDMDTTTKTATTADPGVGNQPTGQQGASTACRRGEKPTLVDGATLPTDVNKDTEGQTTRASRAAQSGVRPRKRASSWSGTAPRAEVKRPQCIEWSSRILPSDTRNRERNKEECGGNAVVPDVTKTAISATRTATHRAEGDASVPMVLVRLITSLRVLPHQSVLARVRIDTKCANSEPLLLQWEEDVEDSLGVSMGDALICPNQESASHVLLTNTSTVTRRLERGEILGEAVPVSIVDLPNNETSLAFKVTTEAQTDSREQERQEKLRKVLKEPDLPDQEKETLLTFLAAYHRVFSLEDGERGETDLIRMDIDTGDAAPKKQSVRRIPFNLRQEVARQVAKMQKDGVIQPSRSPWASPIVLVKKRDGTHRFCVDYRGLNSVTKPDSFPLPRIEDLLDQLGKSSYFSTVDLASGFWQIRMHPVSQEKTAFTTQQGLFEFRVMPFGLTNAPAVFQRLMQQVIIPLNPATGPDFVSVYLDDVLVFSRNLEDHLLHLKAVIEKLADVGLKLKPEKCRFAQKELEYLGHVVSRDGLRTSPRLVDAVRNFPVPKTVQDVRRFLGLSSYYRKFIPNFAKIACPLHRLTCSNTPLLWSPECQGAFQELTERLSTSPVLAYPNYGRGFVLETDASVQGIGAVLGQYQDDDKLHPVSYASRALSAAEKNYSITELETLAVVWAISHFQHHLYGNTVTVYTDHTAVKAVLETPNPTGKHARWWTKVYGRGVKEVRIIYRAGKENRNADALSRSPVSPAPQVGIAEGEVQVLPVRAAHLQDSSSNCPDALADAPRQNNPNSSQHSSFSSGETLEMAASSRHPRQEPFAYEQRKDPSVKEIIDFIEKGALPEDSSRARKIALQESLFCIVDGILYSLDPKHKDHKRAVVPKHLQTQILQETHSSPYGGHFSGQRIYNSLVTHWWWEGMFNDAIRFAKACPECAISTGSGRITKPPLHPIPVSRPFQILGIDVMDLPLTDRGNKHVVVIQDLFTKWPLVFAIPDQKTTRIARILAEEVIPVFGVPECLLSDRGTNLLSNLMVDLCKMLGITKLNTTAYHPQCDGAVERFNRTLKTILRKHAAKFGCQWDRYLPGILWAYRNTPHTSTGEKPSFLLYGMDCRSPTEAAYLPTTEVHTTDIEDYREELMLSLTSARKMAAHCIQKAQTKYKEQYDRKTKKSTFRVGDWILVRFPQDESGRWRKLSRPWHGPYRVTSKTDPDITCTKVYHPQDGTICVHQSRVCHCPEEFPAGYYWYGGKRKGPGRPPKWVDHLLQSGSSDSSQRTQSTNGGRTDRAMQNTRDTAEQPANESGSPTRGQDSSRGGLAQDMAQEEDNEGLFPPDCEDSTIGPGLPSHNNSSIGVDKGPSVEDPLKDTGDSTDFDVFPNSPVQISPSVELEEHFIEPAAGPNAGDLCRTGPQLTASACCQSDNFSERKEQKPGQRRRLRSTIRPPDRLM